MRNLKILYVFLLLMSFSYAKLLPDDFDYRTIQNFKIEQCHFRASRTVRTSPSIIFSLPPESKHFDQVYVPWDDAKLSVTGEIASYKIVVEKVLSTDSLGAKGLTEAEWLTKIGDAKFLKVSVKDSNDKEVVLRNSDQEKVDACYLGIGDYIAVGYDFNASNSSSSNAIVIYDSFKNDTGATTYTYITTHCSLSPVLYEGL